jgi:tRNA nucleotidyltransferase/poly(A) polymerase
MKLTEANREAFEIVSRLRASDHQAYWVGGCVRDLLLGRTPKDIDVATSATPDEITRLFPGAKSIGASFGVMLLGHTEIATFRSEQAYSDGRRPDSVQYETEPRRDAARRDFTINGMFLDPISGEVLDFFGGREDLRNRIVRAIGDARERFAEDHLRLLRAVRFAARLNFTIDDATLAAMRESAPSITRVAAERVRQELTRILTEGGAKRGLELLRGSLLLPQVLPEVQAMIGVEQPPEFHPEGDVFIHTGIMLDLLQPPIPPTLAWGVLLHDVGKPVTQTFDTRIRFNGHVEAGVRIATDILERLRFPNAERDQILSLVANHMRFMDVQRMKESTLKRFLRLDEFPEHLELHRVDCASSSGRLENYEFVREKLAQLPAEALSPPALIGGADLIAAGFQPGPKFREALMLVEEAQLSGEVASKEEALALASDFLASASTTPGAK